MPSVVEMYGTDSSTDLLIWLHFKGVTIGSMVHVTNDLTLPIAVHHMYYILDMQPKGQLQGCYQEVGNHHSS